MEIKCEQCGSHILTTELQKKGEIAATINRSGYGIAKMPILYGITDGFHFFCCKECWNNWLNSRTTAEQRAEGDRRHDKIRKNITSPEFIDGLAEGLNRIQKLFNKTRKK